MITYSKIVVFLKITFFLASISIIGVLFVVSPPDDFGEPLKVSTIGLEKNIAYQILGAKLRGASELGHYFDFTVDSIDPNHNDPKNFSMVNLTGTLSINDNNIYTVSAKKALVNTTKQFVDLTGDLHIKTNTGISGKSQKIRIEWREKSLITSSEVELQLPLGIIYGGTMKVSNSNLPNNSNTYVHIEKGVKFIYTPIRLLKAKQ